MTTGRPNIIDVLEERASKDGARTAYILLNEEENEASRLTFAELGERHQAIAEVLVREGLVGTRVLLFYLPGLDFVAAFFGCLAAGVIPIAVPPPLPTERTERIQAVVQDAAAAAVLTAGALAPLLAGWVTESETLSKLPMVLTDSVATSTPDARGRRPGPQEVAFLQYTSGSTTLPRGVAVRHENLVANLDCIRHRIDLSAESVAVTWLPCFHDMGLINGLIAPLFVGCTCVMMSPLDFIRRPRRWLSAISRYRGTHSGGPNFAYDLCVRKLAARDREGLDLSSWRQAYLSAEPVRRETMDRFFDAFAPSGFRRKAFYPCYGLAEATLAVTGGQLDAEPILVTVDNAALEERRIVEVPDGSRGSTTFVGCGAAGLDTEVIIVHPETRRRSDPGCIGEVWVQSPSVADGYHGKLDASQETFGGRLENGEGPFLRTGDLGFLKNDELFVVGRLDDLIIVRGKNFHPQDLEWTAGRAHPALRAGCAAAFVVARGEGETVVIAQEISRAETDQASVEGMIDAVQEAIFEHQGLRAQAVLVRPGGIPRTSSGKIQRRACRRLFEEGRLETMGPKGKG